MILLVLLPSPRVLLGVLAAYVIIDALVASALPVRRSDGLAASAPRSDVIRGIVIAVAYCIGIGISAGAVLTTVGIIILFVSEMVASSWSYYHGAGNRVDACLGWISAFAALVFVYSWPPGPAVLPSLVGLVFFVRSIVLLLAYRAA